MKIDKTCRANTQLFENNDANLGMIWPRSGSLLLLPKAYLNQTMLSGRFGNLNTLGTLKLCGNNITRPPKAALGALRSLQHLHLCQNQLTQLKKDAFGQLNIVSNLDLSGNKINNISYAAFENLRQLVNIDLSFNNLSFVPPGAFLGIYAINLKKN